MRIETINGRKLVCGHIFPASEVEVGQIWAAAEHHARQLNRKWSITEIVEREVKEI